MSLGNRRKLGMLAAVGFMTCVAIASTQPSLGDEPGRFRLSKLFRAGLDPTPSRKRPRNPRR